MATYRAYNKRLGSWASGEIPDVLDTKALAGVATTYVETSPGSGVYVGSNIITVTSTTGLFPGMGLAIPNIPRGAFIQSIKSATEIVAYAPLLDTATGEWTVSAIAAYSTAAGTGMIGHAHGFNPVPIPEAITNGEVWRNTVPNEYKTNSLKVAIGRGPFQYADPGIMSGGVVPKEDAVFAAITDGSPISLIRGGGGPSDPGLTLAVDDAMIRKPYRTKTRWRHNHWLVSSTGNISTIPADVDIVVQLIASTPAA